MDLQQIKFWAREQKARKAALEAASSYASRRGPQLLTSPLHHFENEDVAYRAGSWIRARLLNDQHAFAWCHERGLLPDAAMGTASDSAGGYLVPEEVVAGIIHAIGEHGALFRIGRVWPMQTKKSQVPVEDAAATATNEAEAANLASNETSPTFDRVTLTAAKRSCYTLLSQELMEDSTIAVAEYLVDVLGRAIALRLDEDLIDGDGSATYGSVSGLEASIGTAGVIAGPSAWSGVTSTHLANVIGALPEKYHSEASWLMSRGFFGDVVQRLALTNGVNLTTLTDGTHLLAGYPIHFCEKCQHDSTASSNTCYFGAFKQAVIVGVRGDNLRMFLSEHVAFTTQQVAVLAKFYGDIQLANMGNSSNAGAVIALGITS